MGIENPRSIYLPLHYGKAPHWLLTRMRKLSKLIIEVIVEEFGEKEFFYRISNPIFFQSFSNVLGFDWNSSGVTTVMTGVLKSVLNNPDSTIRVAGGKGRHARSAPEHIKTLSKDLDLDEKRIDRLILSSKLSAKIDNNAIQDGYDIYHHAVIFSERYFTVIQQGMSEENRLARRYHFAPSKFNDDLNHSGIVAERKEREVINLESKKSKECKKAILDLIKTPNSIKRDIREMCLISVKKVRFKHTQKTLQTTLNGEEYQEYLVPWRVNWKAIERAYNLEIDNFHELLLVDGMGKSTLRALALIADLIYNAEYDKQDPAKYSFALGGKDGVPFPVNVRVYDEVIGFLREVIEQTTIDRFEKAKILRSLNSQA